MKKLLFIGIMLLGAFKAGAQHTIKLSIKKSGGKTALAGATAIISSINKTAIADSLGIATFADIAPGSYSIQVSFVGLEEQEMTVQVPEADNRILEVLLEEGEEHENEVVVTATRTSRTISDIRGRTNRKR
jgi:outer membrane receptor for ferrienterochelin and colicins